MRSPTSGPAAIITNGGVGEFEARRIPSRTRSSPSRAPAPPTRRTSCSTSTRPARPTYPSAYNLRDIDGTTDNAVQPVALQYRVGATGAFTNVPAGFVADATTGPSLATLVTPGERRSSRPRPATTSALVQVRIITDRRRRHRRVGRHRRHLRHGSAITAPAVRVHHARGRRDRRRPRREPDGHLHRARRPRPADAVRPSACATSGAHAADRLRRPHDASRSTRPHDFVDGRDLHLAITATRSPTRTRIDPPDAMAADDALHVHDVAAPPVPAGRRHQRGLRRRRQRRAHPSRTTSSSSTTGATTRSTSSGWSVQYASAAGSTLVGHAAARRQSRAGATTSSRRPPARAARRPADARRDGHASLMSAADGKVALVSSTTALTGACPTDATIVDLVGYGADRELLRDRADRPALSNTTAALRKGDGTIDTDDNFADFDVGAPDPQAAAPTRRRPSLSTTPPNGATGVALAANVTVTFTRAGERGRRRVSPSTCATSGAHPATVSGGPSDLHPRPRHRLRGGRGVHRARSRAASVTDQDADDPPDTMAAELQRSPSPIADARVCGGPATPIHDVQGGGAASPARGQGVTDRGRRRRRLPGAPASSAASTCRRRPPTPTPTRARPRASSSSSNASGRRPRATSCASRGTVAEFSDLTELSPVSGRRRSARPARRSPRRRSSACRRLRRPTTGGARGHARRLRPDADRHRGVQPRALRRGQPLGRRPPLHRRPPSPTPGPAAQARLAENNRSRIVLDDGVNDQNIDPTRYPQGGLSASNTLRVGDTLPRSPASWTSASAPTASSRSGPLTWSHDQRAHARPGSRSAAT